MFLPSDGRLLRRGEECIKAHRPIRVEIDKDTIEYRWSLHHDRTLFRAGYAIYVVYAGKATRYSESVTVWVWELTILCQADESDLFDRDHRPAKQFTYNEVARVAKFETLVIDGVSDASPSEATGRQLKRVKHLVRNAVDQAILVSP